MKNWSNEFKVGIFSILAVMVLGTMYKFLSPEFSGEMATYYTSLRNAGGLVAKSQVKTNGVPIGHVENIELEMNLTKIAVKVDPTIKFPVGSTLEIRSQGMLGDVFVEIVRSPDNGEYIEPGGLIGHSTAASDMQSLMTLFGEIGKDVKKITGAFASSVDSPEGKSNIEGILTNINNASKQINELIMNNKNPISNIVSNLDDTTTNVNKIFGDPKEMENLKENIKVTVSAMNNAATSIEELLVEGTDGNLVQKINNTFDQIDKTATNLGEITDKVNNGEGTVGRLLTDDKTIEKIEGTLDSIQAFAQPVNQTQFIFDYHNEVPINVDSVSVKNTANLLIQPRPDKYYLVGISDNYSKDIAEKTRTTTTANPSPGTVQTSTREESASEKRLKFNAQFAKRWHQTGLRFGIFESTGGVGSDFFMLDDKLKLSVEAYNWDFRKSANRKYAHFRAFTNVTLLNHLYATAGIDDISRLGADGKINRPNYFMGAGLYFNDQDIKTVFGIAASAMAN